VAKNRAAGTQLSTAWAIMRQCASHADMSSP
jgi:hypothetical protein